MDQVKDEPEERDYATPTDATRIRDLLARLALGQRAAARELDIGERDMRGYCAGDKVPRVIMLALERLIDLQRTVCDGVPVRMTWQLIDTAPKDGTDVLLSDQHNIHIAYWDLGNSWWSIDGYVFEEPTHWMPLPELPK